MDKINVIENSKGQFVGINRTDGSKMNARFIGSSNNYIRVFDRNRKQDVKMAKTSVASVNYRGQEFC